MDNTEHVVSALEMSHWDVARAAAFLLNNNSKGSVQGKSISKLKNLMLVATTDSAGESSSSNSNLVNNNVDDSDRCRNPQASTDGNRNSETACYSNDSNKNDKSYIQPTHV